MSILRLSNSAIPRADGGHGPPSARAAAGARARRWATRISRCLLLVAASGVAVSGLVMAPSAGAATMPASVAAVAAVTSAGAATMPASAPAVASVTAIECKTTPCYYRYSNMADGLCIGMPSSAAGTQAIQFTCNTNNTQYWKLIPTNLGYLIQNRGTGLCLAAANSKPAAAAVQFGCNSTSKIQNWFPGGIGDTTFIFYDVATAGNCGAAGECALHPSSNSTASSAKLFVQTPTSNCTETEENCFYAWNRIAGGLG